MKVSVPISHEDRELRLLMEWRDPDEGRRHVFAGVGSLLTNVLLLALAVLLPSTAPSRRVPPTVAVELRKATPLIAPPRELTQRAPNKGKIGREFDLESLLPRPPIQQPPSAPSTTRPAARQPARQFQPPVRARAELPLPEPPKISDGGRLMAALPPGPNIQAPQIQLPPAPAQEKPKVAFESPSSFDQGQTGVSPGRIARPRNTVDEAVQQAVRGAPGGGLTVGDAGEGVGGLGSGLNLPPSQGRTGSSLELLSDPMGVDFRPYLIQVLSAVRRNWFAVIPESAKFGRRGRVQIQFAIDRGGRVPKLVIALPSGAEALDRAAVAGVSASNPFPPLPSEFRGQQIRVQLTFLYNLPSN